MSWCIIHQLVASLDDRIVPGRRFLAGRRPMPGDSVVPRDRLVLENSPASAATRALVDGNRSSGFFSSMRLITLHNSASISGLSGYAASVLAIVVGRPP